MKNLLTYILFFFLLSCAKDKYYAADIDDTSLLPDKGDYLNEDYGTQALATEMAGVFNSEIGMVYYDAATRTIPQLYLTGEKKPYRPQHLQAAQSKSASTNSTQHLCPYNYL